jgi:hypothetical protein
MHEGSCLCGAVRYRVEGELGPLGACHCKRCQKANGTAFCAVTPIQTREFRLLGGQEALTEFESSPGVFRVFCRNCGSPLYSRRSATPELLRLRVGTLETQPSGPPSLHIFVASKAPWHEIGDSAPQFAERPPV